MSVESDSDRGLAESGDAAMELIKRCPWCGAQLFSPTPFAERTFPQALGCGPRLVRCQACGGYCLNAVFAIQEIRRPPDVSRKESAR